MGRGRHNREHPTSLIEQTSDLGKRVGQLAVRRLENRKRWAQAALRSGERADLVVPMLAQWLNDSESPSRSETSLWRLWIEAKAELPGTTADDLDAVIVDARDAGLDVGVLEAVRRTAVTRLAGVETERSPQPDVRSSAPKPTDGLLTGEGVTSLRAPIAGLELTIRSSFVGRTREREQLVQSGVQALQDRTGHLITVTGEPGVGKSRLVAEVVSTINDNVERDGSEVSWFVGRCLAQGRGLTCWALGEIVKAIADVRPHDAPEIAMTKLEERLAQTKLDPKELPELVRQLAPLVGGPGGTQTSDTERFFAWGRALGAIGESMPMALIVEDLHWADDLLLEFLDSLTEQGSPSSLLVIATGRPEFLERVPGWAGGGRSASAMSLSRLTPSDTESLLQNFRTKADEALAPATRAAIVERSGGNPLFAEELARMVDQSGDPNAIHGLPRLVELVVAARLDHLSEHAAQVAFAAASIGRVFWSGAIEAVVDIPASDLRNALAELVRVDLVQRSWSSSMTGQLEYTFWHAIVRDVAASRLPESKIALVHLRAAEWLREVASSRLVDVAEQLAEHYTIMCAHMDIGELSSESLGRAIEAFRLAGQRVRLLDPTRAGDYFERGLAITPVGHPLRGPLLADHAACYTSLFSFEKGEQLCRIALTELELTDDELSRCRILATLAMATSNRGDLRGAIKLLDESMVGLASGEHDEYLEYKALLVFFLGSVGDRERCLEMLPEVWTWCKDAVGSGRSSAVAIASIQAWLVDPVEVIEWFEATLASGTSLIYGSRVAMTNLAQLRSGMEGPRAGLEIIDELLESFVDRPGPSAYIRGCQIDFLIQVGELSRAAESAVYALEGVRSLSPMLVMEFLGNKMFTQMLTNGVVDSNETEELEGLLTLQPGTLEMILIGLRASAFANLMVGNLDDVRSALQHVTRIYEARIDRMSALFAVMRLTMFRLALVVDDLELARRLAATSDPLSPPHVAEQTASRGYLAAADGDFACGARELDDAATAFESLQFDLDALWIRLHQARFMMKAGQVKAGRALEKATLDRLEGFGAFGVLTGALDGVSGPTSGNLFSL